MFITRKEYRKAIERAKREERERMSSDLYIQNRLDDMQREFNRRIDAMEEDVSELKGNQNNIINSVL